jgi:uncharacterized protein (TIGR03790 family)
VIARAAFLALACLEAAAGQGGEQVLIVVNQTSPASRELGEYYRPRRSVPAQNVCRIDSTREEEVTWSVYQQQIEDPIARCLQKEGLREKVLYLLLTPDIPIKVDGAGSGLTAEHASVDSELTLLYGKLRGATYPRGGGLHNPFFAQRDAPFRHPQFPIYLVARIAAFDIADAKALVDRSLAARNRGKFVLDATGSVDDIGNKWLRTAGVLLPGNRVVLDDTARVQYGIRDVIGYAAWGSNDDARKKRQLGFQWLPGAIAMEFVSTDARTLRRPPADWTFQGWNEKQHMFGGSSQSLSADYLQQGATAATGNAYEPYLTACARPDYLLPAYYQGRTLAESYYLSVPLLSWQGVLLGDPLCSLGHP